MWSTGFTPAVCKLLCHNVFTFSALTRDNFQDFETLFGPRGACAGCWCTFWKLPASDYERLRGDGARQVQRSFVDQGIVPGILAYDDGVVAGWVAVEPRAEYPRLARSRVLKPVDNAEVWSVTCFFTAKKHRRKGVTVELLLEAIKYITKKGGKIVEGYPVEPKGLISPAPFVFTGLPAAFKKAGFVEVARNSPARPIFRYYIEE
jgi:GNAT superfamily N-acetyltransferase